MKILIVSPYIYPQGSGVGRIVLSLAYKLAESGHQLIILTSGKKSQSFSNKYHLIKKRPLFYLFNTPFRLRLFFDLILLNNKSKFDLILAFTPVPYFVDIAALVSKIFNLPFYIIYNTFSLKREKRFFSIFTYIYCQFIEKYTLKSAKKIFIYNKKLEQTDILNDFKKRLFYISIGCDRKLFNKRLKSLDDYLLYVGPLNKTQYWKGINYLLKAMKIVKSNNSTIRLKIVGSGDKMQSYKKMTRKLEIGDRVEFLGYQTNNTLISFYQNCRFLVLPSYDQAELTPIVITEAFSCGKTVISTKAAGIPYLVTDGVDGLLVEPKNENALAQAIIKLWFDDELRQKLAGQAYLKSQSFSWSAMAQDIIDVLENNLALNNDNNVK